jgi:hypothetical protein
MAQPGFRTFAYSSNTGTVDPLRGGVELFCHLCVCTDTVHGYSQKELQSSVPHILMEKYLLGPHSHLNTLLQALKQETYRDSDPLLVSCVKEKILCAGGLLTELVNMKVAVDRYLPPPATVRIFSLRNSARNW